jgi:hypothetical protein
MFEKEVIPNFLKRHHNKKRSELVSTASVLLRMAGFDKAAATRLAAAVMSRQQRRYRAAFALTEDYDNQEEKQKLFEGYDALDGISAEQRIGTGLIVNGELRAWVRFSGFAGHRLSGRA